MGLTVSIWRVMAVRAMKTRASAVAAVIWVGIACSAVVDFGEPIEESDDALCSDGLDNDFDTAVDCDDPTCADAKICILPDRIGPTAPLIDWSEEEPPLSAPSLPWLDDPRQVADFGPCPAGWFDVESDRGPRTCAPFVPLRPAACAAGSERFPGQPDCAPLGASPRDPVDSQFPDTIDNFVTWVDASAPPGGNGSRRRPHDSISEGIRDVATTGTVAIAAGEYDERLVIDRPMTLLGVGAADVVVRSNGGSHLVLNDRSRDGVSLRGLRFVGSTGIGVPALGEALDRKLLISGVWASATDSEWVFDEGDVELVDLSMIGGQIRIGPEASARARRLSLRSPDAPLEVEGSFDGFDVSVVGSDASPALRFTGGPSSLARALVVESASPVIRSTAGLELTDVVMEEIGPGGSAIEVDAGRFEATRLVLRTAGASESLALSGNSDLRQFVIEETSADAPDGARVRVRGLVQVDLRNGWIRTPRGQTLALRARNEADRAPTVFMRDVVVLGPSASEDTPAIDSDGESRLLGDRILIQDEAGCAFEGSFSQLDLQSTLLRNVGCAADLVGVPEFVNQQTVSFQRTQAELHGPALQVTGPLSVTLSDVRFTGPPTTLSPMVGLRSGAEATLANVVLTGATSALLVEGGRLTARDVLVQGTPTVGDRPFVLAAGGDVELDSVVLRDPTGTSIATASNSGRLRATDLLVQTTTAAALPRPTGLAVESQSEARLTRVEIQAVRSRGVRISGPGAQLDAEDLRLDDIRLDGPLGHALQVDGGATARLERASFSRCGAAGLLAVDPGSSIVGQRVRIDDVGQCRTCSGAPGIASVSAVGGGNIDLTEFILRRRSRAGAQVGPGGQLRLTNGVVVGHRVGLNLQSDTLASSDVLSDVELVGNDRRLDSGPLPTPTP
jgi:hypothetical protein